MKEELISFDTAKLAKEKGLTGFHTKGYYNNSGEFIENDCCDHNSYPVEYSNTAITQGLLQKWLREKHDINISIVYFNVKSYKSYEYRLRYKNITGSGCTYEQALEEALKQSLELIK